MRQFTYLAIDAELQDIVREISVAYILLVSGHPKVIVCNRWVAMMRSLPDNAGF